MLQRLAAEATAGSLGTDKGRGVAEEEGSEAEVARELWKELVKVRAQLEKARMQCVRPHSAGDSGREGYGSSSSGTQGYRSGQGGPGKDGYGSGSGSGSSSDSGSGEGYSSGSGGEGYNGGKQWTYSPTPEPVLPEVKLTLAGSVADFTSTMQETIKEELAASAGCIASQITLTVAAGSVVITATMPTSHSAATLVANVKSGKLQALDHKVVEAVSLVVNSSGSASSSGRVGSSSAGSGLAGSGSAGSGWGGSWGSRRGSGSGTSAMGTITSTTSGSGISGSGISGSSMSGSGGSGSYGKRQGSIGSMSGSGMSSSMGGSSMNGGSMSGSGSGSGGWGARRASGSSMRSSGSGNWGKRRGSGSSIKGRGWSMSAEPVPRFIPHACAYTSR